MTQPEISATNPPSTAVMVNGVVATRDWVFTFGHGHRAYAAHDSFSTEANANRGKGFSLTGRYVVIHGTGDTARQRMRELFGEVWSAQYASREAAGVDEYQLSELVITE